MSRAIQKLTGLGTSVAAAVVFATTVAGTPAVAQEEVTLRCNSVFPLASALSNPQIMWGEEIERRTDGRISTEDLAMAFYRGGEELQGLGGGLAACGSMNFYFPDALPVSSDSASLPFLLNDTLSADIVNIPFVGDVLKDELAAVNIVPLIGSPAPQSFFLLEPLPHGAAPEDMSKTFEGLRIRTWGIYTDVVRLLGGTPVAMPAGEVPVALRQGIIDGLVTSWDTWKSQAMQYDSPVAYSIPAAATALFGFNKAAWDKFSPQDQALMREVAVEVAGQVADAAISFKEQIIEEAKADPELTVVELSEEEVARWRAALRPIFEEYAGRSDTHRQYLETILEHASGDYTPSWEQ